MEILIDTKKPEKFTSNLINNGSFLRTIRAAIATTGEFTPANGKADTTLARISSLLNVVNAVYIFDLAIKFELIANNTLFIFTNASTDPFNPTSNYSTQDSQNAFDDLNTNNSLPPCSPWMQEQIIQCLPMPRSF